MFMYIGVWRIETEYVDWYKCLCECYTIVGQIEATQSFDKLKLNMLTDINVYVNKFVTWLFEELWLNMSKEINVYVNCYLHDCLMNRN
jgi:hypothetical protein